MFNRPNFNFIPQGNDNAGRFTPAQSTYQYQFPNNGPQLSASVSQVPGTVYYNASIAQPVSKDVSLVAAATNVPPRGMDVQTNFQAGLGVEFKLGK